MALALAVAGCTTPGDAEARPEVVIGVASTTEQQVLAALAALTLEHAGLTASLRPNLGNTVALRRQALAGNVDLYWDYTGAAWALGLGQQNPPAQPVESYQRVRQEDRRHGLVWLEPTEANATLAMFVRPDVLPDGEPQGMEWLAGVLSGAEETLCVDEDFRTRPGGLRELAADYYLMDLTRVRVVSADEHEAVAGVTSGRCFAGLATATAGQAHRAGLVPVADTLGVFPAFIVAPVVTEAALEAAPEVEAVLGELVGVLDTPTLGQLNAAVEGGAEPEVVAREFLAGVLLTPTPTP